MYRRLNLQQRRPCFDGAETAPFIIYISSGFIPCDEDGGHRWYPSLDFGGERERLDHVSRNLFDVLYVYMDQVIIMFLDVQFITFITV
jgi:hypothetical protein